MLDFYVQIDDEVRFSKTVGETDIYLFAGITGDFSPNHVNEIFMKQTIVKDIKALSKSCRPHIFECHG